MRRNDVVKVVKPTLQEWRCLIGTSQQMQQTDEKQTHTFFRRVSRYCDLRVKGTSRLSW